MKFGQSGRMEHFKNQLAQLKGFFMRQDGAVTVDWVVLTGGIVFLGLALAFTVTGNIPGLADQISSTVASSEVVP